MAATVITGTSGAFYYKPAGTIGSFGETNVNSTTNTITIETFYGFQVGDPVKFSVQNSAGASPTGTLPAGLTAGTTYYVISYTPSTGALQVSATDGGSAVDITDDGTAIGNNYFQVAYADYEAVGQVREWTFEITRTEIDVTTIGHDSAQYAPFRSYVAGFAEGTGSTTVYFTTDDENFANRMINDIIQRNQTGAYVKLYVDRVFSAGTVSETLSRSIAMPIVLTSASLSVNPDDAISVAVNFRPSSSPTFDLVKTA
jgi:hypothetical protein